jgi:16S rRNA (guanine527-N7)-methyltransferase
MPGKWSEATPEDIAELFGVSRESLDRLKAYVALLTQWQTRINLIGPASPAEIWTRHVADSLQLLTLIGNRPGRLVDLGSGAGFPGLVLAIALDGEGGNEVHLIESNGKKAAFLRQAARITNSSARIHQGRIERMGAETVGGVADVITARALAGLDELVALAVPFADPQSRALFHKGQDVDRELTETTKSWRIEVTKHPSQIDSSGCIVEIRGFEGAKRN